MREEKTREGCNGLGNNKETHKFFCKTELFLPIEKMGRTDGCDRS